MQDSNSKLHPFDMPLSDDMWIESCTAFVLSHAPTLSVDAARVCASELRRAWPALAPDEAARCYFTGTNFDDTAWGSYEIQG